MRKRPSKFIWNFFAVPTGQDYRRASNRLAMTYHRGIDHIPVDIQKAEELHMGAIAEADILFEDSSEFKFLDDCTPKPSDVNGINSMCNLAMLYGQDVTTATHIERLWSCSRMLLNLLSSSKCAGTWGKKIQNEMKSTTHRWTILQFSWRLEAQWKGMQWKRRNCISWRLKWLDSDCNVQPCGSSEIRGTECIKLEKTRVAVLHGCRPWCCTAVIVCCNCSTRNCGRSCRADASGVCTVGMEEIDDFLAYVKWVNSGAWALSI